jgi:plastocyanin domain-containing protein
VKKKSMMPTIVAFAIAAVVVSIASVVVVSRHSTKAGETAPTNVFVAGGEQTIEINAKDGYDPQLTTAKANLPTVLKIKTNGDFDCSSSLNIPKLGYRTVLPPAGETAVDVPPQAPGSTLKGVCSMGMYSFTIRFE